jgi:putative DNA methylase
VARVTLPRRVSTLAEADGARAAAGSLAFDRTPQIRRRDETLLARVDWQEVENLVRSQQRNREVHTPPISLFRWWARRSHALIGSLLDAAVEAADGDALAVSDPFSGGGTVAIEAARRGLPMYAQDLHPWAVTGLATALDGADPTEFARGADALLTKLAPLRRQLYVVPCDEHGAQSEVLTTFWVRKTACPACASQVFLFPYSLITRAGRVIDEPFGWWGCRSCGHVTRSRTNSPNHRCGRCRRTLADADVRLLPGRMAICPHPRCAHRFPAFQGAPSYEPVLVQRECRHEGKVMAHFARPTVADRVAALADVPVLPSPLCDPIPVGLETRVLHHVGLHRWRDLYPPRQLAVMVAAAEAVSELDVTASQRDRLRLAIIGASEMAGYVSRWDRFYPKAFEALANHRFGVTGLSVETNLLADRGRGTLPRRLKASGRAAEWVSREIPGSAAPTWLPPRHRRARLTAGTTVSVGSSERQRLHDSTVDLVLTDPPYFDDVQYGELAALFLAWSRALGLVPSSLEVDLDSEAVVNTARGTDVERYRILLTSIFRECRRTLKADGRVLLTFHNTDIRAWWALARALHGARLKVRALAVSVAENDADHSKRGLLGFTKDLVIECAVGVEATEPTLASSHPDNPEARELLIAGRCLALGGRDSPLAFKRRFQALRGDLRPQRISPRLNHRGSASAPASA